MKRVAYPSRAQINVHRTELEGYAATEVYQSNEDAGVAGRHGQGGSLAVACDGSQ